MQVTRLLQRYLGRFKLAPEFSEDEVEHYLLPVDDVICSHVVEAPGSCLSFLYRRQVNKKTTRLWSG